MTPEEHNKALGICHLAYGGLSALMVLGVLLFFGAIMFAILGGEAPVGIFMFILSFILLWSLILTLPSFIAGYAILKRKSWAKMASIVAAVLEMMSFPLGTAVAIYSFWFMFGDAGRAMYDKNGARPQQRPYALHDTPPPPPTAFGWDARRSSSREREREYVPPAQPPDWRGE